MSRKKIIWLIILLIVAGGAWYGYKEFNRTNKDLSMVEADITTTAADITREYEQNDSAANKKYLGKVVDVAGIVKEVTKDGAGYFTIVLGVPSGMASVRCAMDTTHQQDASSVAVGSSIIVRGNCTGFNKDEMGLGSDVILNFSVITRDKK